MRSTNQLKVESACSVSNGIIFFSNKKPEYGVMAKSDKSGNICCEHIKTTDFEEKKYDMYDTFYIIKLKIAKLIMIVSLIVSMFFFMEAKFYISLQIVLGGFNFVVTFLLLTENFSKQSSRFHSAEHMIANAFNQLNRIPTLEEAWKFSRFNKKCGTNSITHAFLVSTILFYCTFLQDSILRLVIPLCLILLVSILAKFHLLCWGQIFTTLPPTDMEINIAIAGLKEWLNLEKKYSQELEIKQEKIETNAKFSKKN